MFEAAEEVPQCWHARPERPPASPPSLLLARWPTTPLCRGMLLRRVQPPAQHSLHLLWLCVTSQQLTDPQPDPYSELATLTPTQEEDEPTLHLCGPPWRTGASVWPLPRPGWTWGHGAGGIRDAPSFAQPGHLSEEESALKWLQGLLWPGSWRGFRTGWRLVKPQHQPQAIDSSQFLLWEDKLWALNTETPTHRYTHAHSRTNPPHTQIHDALCVSVMVIVLVIML